MKKRWKSNFPLGRKLQKIFRCMKLTFLLLTCFVVQTFAGLNAQTVTIKKQNASLEEVIWELKQQTRFTFMYNNEDIARIKGIDLNEKEVDVEEILRKCLQNTNLEYVVLNNAIVIKLKMNTSDEKKSITLKGWVYDKKKEPIPGVTVKLTDINLGTATNNKGWFSLSLPLTKGTLEFSFVGFKTQKINFTERTDTLRIILEEDVQTLDETVVVAYGTTTRRKATGAVSVVKAEEFKGIPSANIANLLQGRVAGLDITNLSGAPGGGDVAITVRGYNSLDVEAGRRFSNPLWVIDGVPLNTFTSPITGTNLLSDLNPDMIESIQILKDASSAAIYGSRAANGVIIVTTKKGRQNQDATFSVNFSETWSILPEYPALTTGRAERLLRLKSTENNFRAYLDEKTNSYKYPQSLAEQYEHAQSSYNGFWYPDKNTMPRGNGSMYQDSLNAFYNHSTNYFPIYFETGKVTNANIQAYGGSERITYGIGLGYYNETGVFKGTGFKRIDLNSSMNVIPVPRLNVDIRFNASLAQKKRASSSADDHLRYSGALVPIETIPGEPYKLSSLLPGEESVVWQEVLKAYKGTKEANRAIRLRSNFRLGYDIIDGLNISSSLAADYAISRRNYFSPSYIASDNNSISIGETGINLMVLNENLLSYKKTLHEDHNIEFMAGFSYQYDQEEYNGGSARKSPSDKIYYAPYGMPDLETVGWGDYTEIRALKDYQSDMQEKTLVSYFARLEYGFREKYLFSASIRRDGSSTFGKNNRWGTFPSIAAAWSFSEEPFVRDNLGWVSFGKIRASWGRSGKMFESPYLAYGLMGPGDYSHLGNPTLKPVYGGGLYNEDLSWEETDQYDFGLDVDLFEYRLGVVLDYYYRYTDKLLYRVPLPGDYNGFGMQWANAAALSNEGLELLIKYEIFRRPDLYWKISVNGARNWNRIEKSYNGKDLAFGITGKPLNRIYGYKTNGYVQKQEDLPLYFTTQGESYYLYPLAGSYTSFYRPGDYHYVDVNSDSYIFNDQVFLGSALPIISGGIVNEFRWKNFDLNFSMHYSIGRHMVNQLPSISLVFSTNPTEKFYKHPVFVDINKTTFWQQEGDDSDYAKLRIGSEGEVLDRQVEKVNYLKLKTLTVGYNLPKSLISKWGMEQLRVFVSGENLLTFSNYSGVDPEAVSIVSGVDYGTNYPLARKFTLGLTVKF